MCSSCWRPHECTSHVPAGLHARWAGTGVLLRILVWNKPRRNIRLKDEALDNLPPTLTSLDLSFCGELTDRGLAATGRLPALAALTLRKCNRITDQVWAAGEAVIASCDIDGVEEPGVAGKAASPLPSCRQSAPNIKQGLHKLGACTSLQQLDLSYCQISGAGLAALRPLHRLSSLVLVVSALHAVLAHCLWEWMCRAEIWAEAARLVLLACVFPVCRPSSSTPLQHPAATPHATILPSLPQDCMRAASPPCMALLTELAVDTLDLSDNKRLDDGSMQARCVLWELSLQWLPLFVGGHAMLARKEPLA